MSASNITREAQYIYSDVIGNHNKHWAIRELSNAACHVQWGRVGASGQEQTKQFLSQAAASDFFDTKCREKELKGYEKLKVITGNGTTVVTAPKQTIAEIAAKQIEANSPATIALIKRLAEANIHNILSATTLTYDTSRGTFSTPLGVVTQDAIDGARDLLSQMTSFVQCKDFNNHSYIKLINRYLRLVPQKVGARLDSQSLYPDIKALQKQQDILDSLEASFNTIVARNLLLDYDHLPKLFEAKLQLITDPAVITKIGSLYRATRQTMHACYRLDVKQVYQIEITSMKNAFENNGSKVGNIMELWHGTKVGNLLSILKSGIIIPPANANFVTGRLFGSGIYASDQSTKSLNYSYGSWSNTIETNCFMLLCDVAMGKYYVPNSSGESLPKRGYDSTFAKANHSGVRNNEMVIYNPNQINPKYLVEFTPDGR
jgi:poly [ADP-ribose] polymerase 2/3/4